MLIILCALVGSFQVALEPTQEDEKDESEMTFLHSHHHYHQQQPRELLTASAYEYYGPSLIEIILGIVFLLATIILCVFLPLCYPLSLWDLVSVYFHWEECDFRGGDYAIHACDIMVC